MSHISKVSTKITEKEDLVTALQTLGFEEDQIEVYDTPRKLSGYDHRNHKAEVIIRKRHLGNAWNDIGFQKREDGTFEALISDPNMNNSTASRNKYTKGIKSFGEDWMKLLLHAYAAATVKRVADDYDYVYEEEYLDDGRIEVNVQLG